MLKAKGDCQHGGGVFVMPGPNIPLKSVSFSGFEEDKKLKNELIYGRVVSLQNTLIDIRKKVCRVGEEGEDTGDQRDPVERRKYGP